MGSVLNVPLKVVLPFYMDGPNEPIPEGFVVPTGQTLNSSQQDINPGGNYTCPDLRNTFLIWGDATKSAGTAGTTDDNASGAPGPKGQGGTMSVTLAESQMPAHTHNLQRQVLEWPYMAGVDQQYLVNVRDQITHTEITQSAGGGQSHENRPRYHALIPIMRVKS